MNLLSQELARAHQAQRLDEAERYNRARRVAVARRLQRRAEAASRRARNAAAQVH